MAGRMRGVKKSKIAVADHTRKKLQPAVEVGGFVDPGGQLLTTLHKLKFLKRGPFFDMCHRGGLEGDASVKCELIISR